MRLIKTVPVIFIGSGDPVEDGLMQSLAHPGGNVTGFAVMEPSLGAKLLGMLKQIAPRGIACRRSLRCARPSRTVA